jgi:hypothetical protein
VSQHRRVTINARTDAPALYPGIRRPSAVLRSLTRLRLSSCLYSSATTGFRVTL